MDTLRLPFVLALIGTLATPVVALDLSHAVVVAPAGLSRLEKKAVTLLVEEVEKRSQIRLEVRADLPATGITVVALGQAAALQTIAGLTPEVLDNRAAEGFHVRIQHPDRGASVTILGLRKIV